MIKYVPTERGKGKASIAINIDMKLNLIPLWIIEIVSKKFCMDFLEVIIEVSGKFGGSKWEEKVKKHPESFNFFRDITNEYYEKHQLK